MNVECWNDNEKGVHEKGRRQENKKKLAMLCRENTKIEKKQQPPSTPFSSLLFECSPSLLSSGISESFFLSFVVCADANEKLLVSFFPYAVSFHPPPSFPFAKVK
jgi:hypothetical protein